MTQKMMAMAVAVAALTAGVVLGLGASMSASAAEDDPPLALARDGFFYVGGHNTTVNGHTYVVGQMYVEMRIPAQQTHPFPIIMVHGGTRTGTTYTGTPDGRESWAQYFARRGYAVYVVDQPGRGRSGYLAEGPMGRGRSPTARAASAAICNKRNSSCGRKRICTPNGRATALPTIRSRCR
jgi:pimeloyl-ACP methyl ester carboxylesterase